MVFLYPNLLLNDYDGETLLEGSASKRKVFNEGF